MKRLLINWGIGFLSSLLVVITLSSCKSKKISNHNTHTLSLDSIELALHLKTLTSNKYKGRLSGTKEALLAAQYIKEFLIQHDIEPYFNSYFDTLSNFNSAYPGVNVVGWIKGTEPSKSDEAILISAHYDHIGTSKKPTTSSNDTIYNGANDNATGVASLMQLVKYFSKLKKNKRPILIAFFAAEEKGLLGSFHLSKRLKQENRTKLYTQLNIEMIGSPMNRSFKTYVTGFSKSNFAQELNTFVEPNFAGALAAELKYQLFYRSDNFPFFKEFNIPAHTISTFDFENYSYYHHLEDEFEKIDIKHLYSITSDLSKAILGLTNSEKTIKLYTNR